MLNLGPCAMLPPHYHPRAANYVVAVQGNTTTFMYEENGARLITETLTPGKGTIFPQGSMHMMVNNGESEAFFCPSRAVSRKDRSIQSSLCSTLCTYARALCFHFELGHRITWTPFKHCGPAVVEGRTADRNFNRLRESSACVCSQLGRFRDPEYRKHFHQWFSCRARQRCFRSEH